MTTPFTILNVSDLHINTEHIEDQKDAIDKLSEFVRGTKIDFLVIAGDVIDKTPPVDDNIVKEDDSTLFERAETIIGDLMDKCGITDFSRVIIVPGNHDLHRDTVKETPEFLEERTRFFINSIATPTSDIITEEVIGDFREKYEYSFSSFSDWYRRYCDEKSYHWDKTLLGENLETGIGAIQGYKVFEDYHVVFVCINTEWNNNVTFIKKTVQKKPVKIQTPYLIQSFIKSTFDEIDKKYPGFTVISVMHRSPYNLAWSDQYSAEYSPAESLYYYSDIIISGHEHSQPFFPPHRMTNRAQLLNLGTVSERSRDNVKKHHAALMKIDSFYDTSELVHLEYDEQCKRWKMNKGSHNQFCLNPKLSSYFKGASDYFVKGFNSGLSFRCRADSDNESDISAAINNYYKSDVDTEYLKDNKIELNKVNMVTVDSSAGLDDAKVKTINSSSSEETTIIIIYGIIRKGIVKMITESIETRFCELYGQFLDKILTGGVVLQKVVVEVPEDDVYRLPDSFVNSAEVC